MTVVNILRHHMNNYQSIDYENLARSNAPFMVEIEAAAKQLSVVDGMFG